MTKSTSDDGAPKKVHPEKQIDRGVLSEASAACSQRLASAIRNGDVKPRLRSFDGDGTQHCTRQRHYDCSI